MPSLPSERAKTLKQAFQFCNLEGLRSEDFERYYVDLSSVRSMEAIQGVSTRLDFLEPGRGTILFTGHRGCGKTTELRRLQRQWETDYRVIYLVANEELDITDVEYIDLYLVLIKRVADDLAYLGLSFNSTLLNQFQTWFMEVTSETEESVQKSISLETSAQAGFEVPLISKLTAKLLAQIKGTNIQKTKIRQTLQQDIGRLKSDINLLLKDGFEKLTANDTSRYQKGFLVIFDNLDRVEPEVGNRLFFDYAAQLQELDCTLIYTVPISIACSHKNLNHAFGKPNIVPMVNIYRFDEDSHDLELDKQAARRFAQIVAQRIEIDIVFESQPLLGQLVLASGGHARQLMMMTATACLTAATRGHAKVLQEDVVYAIKQEQFNFERIIPDEHYPLMVEVCRTKRIKLDAIGQLMLFNISVLEYESSDRRWNYINPVIKQSDAFKQALKNAGLTG